MNTLNLEVLELDEVSKVIKKSAGFVMGSPTLGGHMPTQVTHCLLQRSHIVLDLPCPNCGADSSILQLTLSLVYVML